MKNKFYATVLAMLAGFGQTGAAELSPATNDNLWLHMQPKVVIQLTPAFVNQLAEEMRTNHPALRAAGARTSAATAGVAAVRTWDDPMLTAGAMTAEEMMRRDDGDIIYGVEQKLPLFGKPALARKVARAELAVETAGADYQFQFLRNELAQAVFRTALADQMVAIGGQDLGWLQTMVETMESKYRVNAATLVELTQIQNEQARRATQLQTDRQNLIHLRLSLNRLLNRDLQSPWPRLELPPVAAPVLYSPQLVQLATRYEPKLRMMREQIKQAEAVVSATRRSRLPDVSVGAQSRNYSGNGEWRQAEFMLNFSLPLFNKTKYRADIHRDEARLKATEYDAVDYTLSLQEEVHSLTVKIDAARRETLLYRDGIIPRSETALESAHANWESGRGMFRDLLETRRMLLESRLMFVRAVSEQYQMLSDLVLCCGLGDLEALQMLNATSDANTSEPKP